MSLAVIFGGKSCEHDVSIATGVQVLAELKAYKPVPVYINPDNEWFTGKALFTIPGVRSGKGVRKVYMRPGSRMLYSQPGRAIAGIDEAVICCHGAGGEDGTLQGLMELCGTAYTCSGVLESALCLDKSEFKRHAAACGFPVLPYVSFTREEWNGDIYAVADRLNEVGYPFMIKPSRLGSSIGIGSAANESELAERVRTAFMFDGKVVAEKLLTGFREFNCAVLSDGKETTVSCVEEPIGWKNFLTYSDKYAGKAAVRRRIPADLPPEMTERVRSMTEEAFRCFGLSGVARIDYMLSESGELYLNEINTVPGSLASYFFIRGGMSVAEFYRRLLNAARLARKERERTIYRFAPPSGGVKR